MKRFVIVCCLLFAGPVSAELVFAWTNPNTYEDGSALNPATDLDGANFYCGDVGSNDYPIRDKTPSGVVVEQYQTAIASDAPLRCVMLVRGSNGRNSKWSAPVRYDPEPEVIKDLRPNRPTINFIGEP